jgi:hypothetical protein
MHGLADASAEPDAYWTKSTRVATFAAWEQPQLFSAKSRLRSGRCVDRSGADALR